MSVDARDLLGKLGIEITSVSGHNLLFRCPLHGSDRHPSARMHAQTGVWLCSTCQAKGNAMHFLSRLHGVPYESAKATIESLYGVELLAADGDLAKAVRRSLGLDLEPLPGRARPSGLWVSFFVNAWEADENGLRALDYMVEQRGFHLSMLDCFGIGYDPNSGRVAIAVRDKEGNLVGFKARAVDGKHPRYLVLGDTTKPRYGFHTYSKSEHVYGLNYMPDGARAVLVEGELNVVALAQKTKYLAIGVAGSEFSERQRELIVERCGSVVVYFDDDLAGRRGSKKVAQMLGPYLPVSIVRGARGDAAELDGREIEKLVEGARPALSLLVSA